MRIKKAQVAVLGLRERSFYLPTSSHSHTNIYKIKIKIQEKYGRRK